MPRSNQTACHGKLPLFKLPVIQPGISHRVLARSAAKHFAARARRLCKPAWLLLGWILGQEQSLWMEKDAPPHAHYLAGGHQGVHDLMQDVVTRRDSRQGSGCKAECGLLPLGRCSKPCCLWTQTTGPVQDSVCQTLDLYFVAQIQDYIKKTKQNRYLRLF